LHAGLPLPVPLNFDTPFADGAAEKKFWTQLAQKIPKQLQG
jgi:hypothetical protein